MVDANSRWPVVIGIVVVVVILVLILFAAFFIEGTSSNGGGTGGNGGGGGGGTDCSPISPPTGIVVEAEGLSQLRVSFNEVTLANRYRVYVGVVPDFTENNALTSVLGSSSPITVSGLVAGREYYVRVVSLNDCLEEGPQSLEFSTFIGFPPFFKIVSRSQPALVLGTGGGTASTVGLEIDCGSDSDCVFVYDNTTKTVRPYAFSTGGTPVCLGSEDQVGADPVQMKLCEDYTQERSQWTYFQELGAFCHSLPSDLFRCIRPDGLLLPGSDVTVEQFVDINEFRFDIVGVPEPTTGP